MSVFEKILSKVHIGLELRTPSSKRSKGLFKVTAIDENKVVFFIKTIEIEVSKRSWNGIPDSLGERWVRIGANHIDSSKLDPDTLEKYLRNNTPSNKMHSQGSYVAPLLEYIGIAEIDRKRPARH